MGVEEVPTVFRTQLSTTDFTSVIGRAENDPDPVPLRSFCDHWTPEKSRGGDDSSVHSRNRVRYTPQPAEPDASDAEASVYRTTSGEESGVLPRVTC